MKVQFVVRSFSLRWMSAFCKPPWLIPRLWFNFAFNFKSRIIFTNDFRRFSQLCITLERNNDVNINGNRVLSIIYRIQFLIPVRYIICKRFGRLQLMKRFPLFIYLHSKFAERIELFHYHDWRFHFDSPLVNWISTRLEENYCRGN